MQVKTEVELACNPFAATSYQKSWRGQEQEKKKPNKTQTDTKSQNIKGKNNKKKERKKISRSHVISIRNNLIPPEQRASNSKLLRKPGRSRKNNRGCLTRRPIK
ncbi:hypothetical protein AVEN_241771-1 [Araneus ventricosus]|uniref:Uncharacterized protein n=1 Tax=Araneus ventricosus TaxID=182803 RepID=A0A4Y2FJW2_ARAVE|nr:hypothetical protein AVEN_241771-1 [Araneus ventricosus]